MTRKTIIGLAVIPLVKRALPAARLPMQDLRTGARSADSSNQFTLWDPNIHELNKWVPDVGDKLRKQPQITEVNTSIYCFRRSVLAPALLRPAVRDQGADRATEDAGQRLGDWTSSQEPSCRTCRRWSSG